MFILLFNYIFYIFYINQIHQLNIFSQMNKSSEMDASKILLKKRYERKTQQLSELFDPDSIRNKTSLVKIGQWGGIDSFQKSLLTSFKKGISSDENEHKKRQIAFGNNNPIIKPPKTFLELIIENFEDEMLRILCAAAVISLILGIATQGIRQGWLEGASILVAVVLIVSVTSGNNYIKQQQFRKLNAVAQQKQINVLRSGQKLNISVYDLLVGDIVEIQTGQILSVDGLLIRGNNVWADESSITGESDLIKITVPDSYQIHDDYNPFLISGSKIMEGTGIMLVLAVGQSSYFGKLKLKIQQDPDSTPLQQKLEVLANQIGAVGMVSAACTFVAMFIHYIYDCAMSQDFQDAFFNWETAHEMIEYFIIAVSIVVVAVPEGLPLAVTIALAYSVGKMKDQNNLVRYLQACETMGGANNICSDKTGTLTKNLMTVTKIFIQNVSQNHIDSSIMKDSTVKLISLSICANSNANPKFTPLGNRLQSIQIGNKTECALLQMAYKFGFDYKLYRNMQRILKVFPFSSQRKKMTTIYRDDKTTYAFTKGAPDFLLQKCTKYIGKNGVVSKINNQYLSILQSTISQFASESLRTILLTYKQVSPEISDNSDDYQCDLIIIGMVGIKDPLRDEIPLAVQQCHQAGVIVRMVTGDNKETAVAIAKEAGILDRDWSQDKQGQQYTVMEGKQFRTFVQGLVSVQQDETVEKQGDDKGETKIEVKKKKTQYVKNMDNFKKVAAQLRVLARSSPQDKFIMATGLKQLGQVVAMTGDGTNDAPALKKADIGFAMGIAGTQVAKQASGIILLDDNFKSIVTAMKWGRNIFDCIRKFLQFQLTVNFVALVMAFVGGAVLRESPLNPIQMLWVNLIMDTLASLALATQPPTDQLLTRKPYSRLENLITGNMWKNIISQGIMQIIILGVILFKGPVMLNIPSSIGVKDWNDINGKHYSIFFNVFVLLQIFNEINARKLKHSEINVFKNFFNNPLFIIILIGTIIIQLAMVHFGGKSLKTVRLTFEQNLLCLLLGSVSLFSGFLFKTILPENLKISLGGFEWGNTKIYWKKPVEESGGESAVEQEPKSE